LPTKKELLIKEAAEWGVDVKRSMTIPALQKAIEEKKREASSAKTDPAPVPTASRRTRAKKGVAAPTDKEGRYRAICNVRYGVGVLEPGTVITLPKTVADSLIAQGAIEPA